MVVSVSTQSIIEAQASSGVSSNTNKSGYPSIVASHNSSPSNFAGSTVITYFISIPLIKIKTPTSRWGQSQLLFTHLHHPKHPERFLLSPCLAALQLLRILLLLVLELPLFHLLATPPQGFSWGCSHSCHLL